MANTIRQDIENIIIAKASPMGDSASNKGESRNIYYVNHSELRDIHTLLTGAGEPFPELFYNVKDFQYLVWDEANQYFCNLKDGSEYFVQAFYDQFDDIVVFSPAEWTFTDGVHINNFEFGTDNVNLPYTNGMYVSDDGGTTNSYTAPGNAGVSHATMTNGVVIPASASKVRVRIKALSNGDSGLDELRVFAYNAAPIIAGDTLQLAADQFLHIVGETEHDDFEFELDASFTGVTVYLSFQWENTTVMAMNPPAHIQSVEISYI